MNELLEKKLNELENAEKFECWYLVKQQTSFIDVCYLVHFLERFKQEKPSLSLEDFIKDEVTKLNEMSGLSITTVHRCLLVASYYGLITKTAEKGSTYEDCEITNVFYEIKQRCNGKFEDTEKYSDIIKRQIEKIYITTPIDDQYQNIRKDFNIYPVVFLYKVLLELGISTGKYSISISEYDYLVDTAKTYDEFLDIILLIKLFREDKSAQRQFETKLDGKFDNRMKLAFRQLDTLDYTDNYISIKPNMLKEIQSKIFFYETNRARLDKVNKLATLQSCDDLFAVQYDNTNELSNKSVVVSKPTNHISPVQKIFYGVPGCGKSHKISEMLKDKRIFNIDSEENQIVRTVFHPDYTNTDFIGQILPELENEKVKYVFKPGPFTKILAQALCHSENQYVLIVEEINRGNAAAIFGEIFQLLDRIKFGETKIEKIADGEKNVYGQGWSEYFFMNDDINEYVRKECSIGANIEKLVHINGINFSLNTGIRLPPNLSILATMNTSDQNVFTLDNAFQRRWKMEYISNNIPVEVLEGALKNQYNSIIGNSKILWGTFRNEINKEIANPENGFSNSEDKQLGLFFIQTDSDIEKAAGNIDETEFSNKVLKYLWNDIFKRDKYLFKDDITTFGDLLTKFKGIDAFENCFTSDFVERLKIKE